MHGTLTRHAPRGNCLVRSSLAMMVAGVCPSGDQVQTTERIKRNPDSSSSPRSFYPRPLLLFPKFGFFLIPSNARVRVPAGSIANYASNDRRGRGDIRFRTCASPPRQSESWSTNRFSSHARGVPAGADERCVFVLWRSTSKDGPGEKLYLQSLCSTLACVGLQPIGARSRSGVRTSVFSLNTFIALWMHT